MCVCILLLSVFLSLKHMLLQSREHFLACLPAMFHVTYSAEWCQKSSQIEEGWPFNSSQNIRLCAGSLSLTKTCKCFLSMYSGFKGYKDLFMENPSVRCVDLIVLLISHQLYMVLRHCLCGLGYHWMVLSSSCFCESWILLAFLNQCCSSKPVNKKKTWVIISLLF